MTRKKKGTPEPENVSVTWTAGDEFPEPEDKPKNSNVLTIPSSAEERSKILAKVRGRYFTAGGQVGEGS